MKNNLEDLAGEVRRLIGMKVFRPSLPLDNFTMFHRCVSSVRFFFGSTPRHCSVCI